MDAQARAARRLGLRPRAVRRAHERWRARWRLGSTDADVVVVGLGGAGGVAVEPLAAAGLNVVGLEAGTRAQSRATSRPTSCATTSAAGRRRRRSAIARFPSIGRTLRRRTIRAPRSTSMMNGVGGTTLHYWAQSWRLNPWDFKVVSETTRRYGAARVPRGSTVEDWPFGLEELEPYYDKVERAVGVSGQAGNVKGVIDRARQHLRRRARSALPDAAAARHRVHGRHGECGRSGSAGIRSGPGGRELRDLRRTAARVSITASAIAAAATSRPKNSTAVSTIPRAERTGKLAIVTEAHVTRIDVDARRPRRGRAVLERRRDVRSARVRRAARGLHVRERAAVVAVDVGGVSARTSRTITGKSAGTTSRTTRPAACSRCFRAN